MWIILVIVPTVLALYYMAKANKPNQRKEVIVRIKLDELPPSTDATQTEWEFKQYHKN